MNRTPMLIATSLLLCAPLLATAEEPNREAGQGIVIRIGEGKEPTVAASGTWNSGKSAAQWYIDRIDKIVNLTDDQKQNITKLIEARDNAQQEFRARNAEKFQATSKAVTEAYKSKDNEAIAKAQKSYQEIYAPMVEMVQKTQRALDGVLTHEQRAKLRENQLAMALKGMTSPIELSDEQRAKLKAAWTELKDDDDEAFERKLPQIVDKILNRDQKRTIFRTRALAYVKGSFGRANLTAEQLQKVQAAIDELAGDESRKFDVPTYQKIWSAVNGLLTDEQKAATKSPWGAVLPRAETNPSTAKAAWTDQRNDKDSPKVKTSDVPTGGIQFIIVGENEGGGDNNKARTPRDEQPSNRKAAIRERLQQQHELTERAAQTYRKIESLGDGDRAEAKKFWEELEQIEGELRETAKLPTEPRQAVKSSGISEQPAIRFRAVEGTPGAPVAVATQGTFVLRLGDCPEPKDGRLQPLAAKAAQLAEVAKRLSLETAELHEAIDRVSRQPVEQPAANLAPARGDSDVQQLRSEVAQLRRQLEEIKALVKKSSPSDR